VTDPDRKSARKAAPPERTEVPAVRVASQVTNAIKLGGLLIAGNEAILQDSPHDAVVFAVAAFMMAGAQGLDSFLTAFFGDKK
jgi:hypothetical protein